ncbi:TPA: TIGR03758 family integrating conjugative element protein [Salmonella enterica]|uniref:TIGR03758 family integrating conjugative element protein n=1 Tax=Salmonella enterica TaxID=28901 RepID=UPI0011181D36|nr:TIGR03758 family integrating conjugative element protein [Salmonella enterica]HBD1844109.1 TIGR03758 family integrating conjugative element protein [Salmonella enterica]
MSMTSAQSTAFKAASGNIDVSILKLLFLGFLFAALFLWAAWALVDVYHGWANQNVRSAALGRFAVRVVVLLTISIWMFAS